MAPLSGPPSTLAQNTVYNSSTGKCSTRAKSIHLHRISSASSSRMVLLPGPAMAPLSGPPSAFALSMRPWLLAIFFLFIPVAVARFLVIDVIGGIFLLLTGGIGWYALKGSMDVSWLLCLAIILFMNGIFDAIILAARASDTHYPLFGEKLP